MPKKEVLEAIATLVGFIIGAGILGIPFVEAHAGFLTGLIDIIVIGLAIWLLNLYIGEIVLRTEGSHQLSGYAHIYLGKWGRRAMTFGMVFGLYGALIAYIVKEGEFLSVLLSPYLGGNPLLYSIVFCAIGSYIVFSGLKAIEKSELFMVALVILIVLLITLISIPYIQVKNLSGFEPKNFLVPFGVILFAYIGMGAIPELGEELKGRKSQLKKVIHWGSAIPLIVYILFALAVVGVTGIENATDGAIIGLGNVIGPSMLIFGILFGILAMATSFIAVGTALKEMYCFDYSCSSRLGSSLSCIIPLALAIVIILAPIENAFFRIIEVTGIVSGGIMGILIIAIRWKAVKNGTREPEYSLKQHRFIGTALMLMFIVGMAYELLKIFGWILS